MTAIALAIAFLAILLIIILLNTKNTRLKNHFQNQAIMLSTIYNTIPDLVYCMDTDCKFINCNRSYEEFVGLNELNIIGKTDLDIYSDASGDKSGKSFMDVNLKVISEGKPITLEEIGLRSDNVNVLLKTTKTPLIQIGKIIGLLGISRDISDHRAAEEEAYKASRAKTDFLARMSHEIRTPLNAILGITEIQLQDPALLPATQEALIRILNSGDMLLGIINNILDLSKIETGRMELTSAGYDAASMINDIVQLNILRYENKPIEFRLEISENVPSVLIGDELRIKQVLNNLLSNAFKYTEKGMVTLSVSTENESTDEDSDVVIVFNVSDTGQGMTEDQINKLGDMYLRFTTEANQAAEGTGLGMNITMTLIQMMNGRLSIKSTPMEGSSFTAYIPQKKSGSGRIGKEQVEKLERFCKKSINKPRSSQVTHDFMPYGSVLIVDDVETNIYVAKGLLAPYGLSIDSVTSGFEAIDKIKDGRVYDIIFMDHMMPKMDGIETTRIIREELNYKGNIVALTANALIGQSRIFLNSGFDSCITKPIDIRQMNMLLNKMIRDKQPPEVLKEAALQKAVLAPQGKTEIDSQLADVFINDAKKAHTTLEMIIKNKCREADDITAFVINVHAMKSALANINEKGLSEYAAKLEQAGRDKKTDLILSEGAVFLDSLQKVVEKITLNQIKCREASGEPEDENAEEVRQYLKEKLIVIQEACSKYNKKTAKDTLTELRQKLWSQSITEQLNSMAENLLHSSFEEVISAAEDMLSK